MQINPGNNLAAERLLSLAPHQWQVLESLFALEDADWVTLEDVIQKGGVAVVSPSGE